MSATCTKDIYLPVAATVLDVRSMTASEKFFKFRLDEVNGQEPYRPGQFMELSLPGIGECPISISSSPTRCRDGSFEMVIRDAGTVTHMLHSLNPGDKIGVRGPFGTDFPVDGEFRGKDLIFICGGIGLLPVRSAIHYVLDNRKDYGDVTILFGARTPQDRMFIDELYDWKIRGDVNFHETVDVADPSWGGNVGVITTLMPFVQVNPRKAVAVVCGPPIMYKFVLIELQKRQLANSQIFLSLERHMKCGVGKCGHCQINGMYACQDGPVVKYADIVALEEAI